MSKLRIKGKLQYIPAPWGMNNKLGFSRRLFRFAVNCLLFISCSFNTAVFAHGDQELIYPGSDCRLDDDAVINQAEPHTSQARRLRNRRKSMLFATRFGTLRNISPENSDIVAIPVVCPIVRGAIRKDTGLFVTVKFRTAVGNIQQNGTTEEFRCTIRNINSDGRSANEVRTTRSQLSSVTDNAPHNISMVLDRSNKVNGVGSRDGGGYSLTCWLPKQRRGVFSEIIHYAVREKD